jgi:hypothetical protein
MDQTDFAEQRQDLLQSIEWDREEVRVALHELTAAAELKLDVGERIKASPVTWVMGAFLVGLWLGSRAASLDASGQRRPS